MPQLIHSPRDIQHLALEFQRSGRHVGLVPTMGALHEGHLSLVRRAKAECDVAIATVFVNPTQFGPREDFAKYPRTLDQDCQLLASADCDYVFAPSADDMYPAGFSTYVEPPAVAAPLEGSFRPGHFRGVCTVVLKLLNLVPSNVAYFGQKDYQQSLVIRHMVRDFDLPVKIEVCPIVREPDGLAMSSRNRYLSPDERAQSLALSQALKSVQDAFAAGERSADKLSQQMQSVLRSRGIERIDYATVVDSETLDKLDTLARPAVALIACHVGTTRLIDNQLLPS